MEEIRKNGFCKRYIGKYTMLFLAVSLGVFLPFLLAGKSLVWRTDGVTQYVPYLYYAGNYLREFLEGLFDGQLLPKMFDFTLGMGDDVGAVFRSHPLDFLSVLVPGRYAEYLYEFLLLLRVYLAGLAFSAFCFYWKKPERAVLIGSVVYLFCGYTVVYGVRHSTFNSALIVFPLMLLGAELVMRRKNLLFFSLVTALGFISNYYFMYICSIAMAGYVLLRFFDLYREKRWKNFFLTGLRLLGSYLLGTGLVAVVLLPAILRLLSSARLGNESSVNLLFYEDAKRLAKCFLDLISPYRSSGSGTNLNFCVLVIPALVVLFTGKLRKHMTLKAAVIIEFAALLVPAGGYVLSGFSTVNNRWVYILAFTLSFVCVSVMGEFARMSKKQVAVLAAALVVYCGLAFGFMGSVNGSRYWIFGMAELAVCTAVLLLLWMLRVSERCWFRGLLLLTAASVVLNGYVAYDGSNGNIIEEYVANGEAADYYSASFYNRFNNIQEEDFYRVDSNTVAAGGENASVVLGYQGISMYNSILNPWMIQYLLDQENPGINAVHRVFSLDGRAASEALANVRYFMTTEREKGGVPYGFTLSEELSDEEYQIYENQYPLSLGYTYDTCISSEDYEALGPLEKQQVMLEAVVLEKDADADGVTDVDGVADADGVTDVDGVADVDRVADADGDAKTGALEQIRQGSDEILTVSLEKPQEGENITATENGYNVGAGGGSIRLTYEKKAGYECYLRFVGFYKNTDATRVNIDTPGISKHVTLRGAAETYTLNRTEYLVNLGYSQEESSEEIVITFLDAKKYQLDGLELCYVPMDRYESNIENLNDEALEETEVTTNTAAGKVSLSSDKYMVFSIPYSDGWTAYVDGEKQELERANVMYLGLMLEAGEHEIVLKYRTPGVAAGAVITLASVVIFAVVFGWRRKKRKGLYRN